MVRLQTKATAVTSGGQITTEGIAVTSDGQIIN